MLIFIFNTHGSQSDCGVKRQSDRICYFHLIPLGIYVQSSDNCFRCPIFPGQLSARFHSWFLVIFSFSFINTSITRTQKLDSHHLTFAWFKSLYILSTLPGPLTSQWMKIGDFGTWILVFQTTFLKLIFLLLHEYFRCTFILDTSFNLSEWEWNKSHLVSWFEVLENAVSEVYI